MTTLALIVMLVLLAVGVVFQTALACGAPWGRLAWGGAHRVLPRRLRIGSLTSVVLYVAFAVLLLSRTGVLPGGDSAPVIVLTWVLFGYSVVGVVLNGISRSRAERWTMTPVCAMLAGMTLIIALS